MQTEHKFYNDEITSKLWHILDLFKGEMDIAEQKGMVCSLLFLKFIEESRADESLKNTIHDIIILRKLNQVSNIGDKLNQIFYELERENSHFRNIFSCIDFSKYPQSKDFDYKLIEALSIISTFDFKNRHKNFAYTFDIALDFLSRLEGKKSGKTFTMQVEAIVDGFTQMKIDLDSEKRAMQRIWKQREKQIEKVVMNTVDMYGSMRGIAGSAIPDVKALELPEFEPELEV